MATLVNNHDAYSLPEVTLDYINDYAKLGRVGQAHENGLKAAVASVPQCPTPLHALACICLE